MSLAAAGAASTVHALVRNDVFDIQLAAVGVIALSVFWALNSTLLAVAVSCIQQRRLLPTTWHLVRSDVGLLPFGYMGFLTGALATAGVVDVWLALVGVLALLDQAVIRAPQRTAKALMWSTSAVGATAAGIILAMTQGSMTTPALALLCAGGLVAFTSAEELRPGLGAGVVIAAAVAAAIMLQGTEPVAGAVLVGVATCLPVVVQSRTVRPAVRSMCVSASASLSIGLVSVLFQGVGSAIVPAMAFGAIAGMSALLVSHTVQGMWLVIEGKRHLYRSALDLFYADAPIALVAGLLGAAAGWGSVKAGAAVVVLAVVLAVVAIRVVAILLRKRDTGELPAEEDLLDVVRSAVLDLPASRLERSTSLRSRVAR
jgi:hypothetical protein